MASIRRGHLGCLGLAVAFVVLMVFGEYAQRRRDGERTRQQAQAVALQRAIDAKAKSLVQSEARDALEKADISTLSLERREDLQRVRRAFEVTEKTPNTVEHWSNTAVLLWVLKAEAEARQVVDAMMRRFPGAKENEGVLLNAFVVTGKPQFNRHASSHLIAAQRRYNVNFRSTAVPIGPIEQLAEDKGLPTRLRAKAFCLLGLQFARSAARVKGPDDLRKSLDYFSRARRLDPDGAIGKMAAEDSARIQAWWAGTKKALAY